MRWIPALALLPIGAAQDQPAALPNTLPGWKLTIIAQVPDLHYPTVVCCAPDGRIFVAEDPMDMTGPVNVPSDRILCLHPDGRTTVFADKLFAVFGLKYIDGKLYVHHTPRFSLFTDDGGVGRDRVDLIECTNPKPWAAPPPGDLGFNDHIPSNCTLAMDGRLYVSTGDKGIYGASGRDGSKIEIRGGGIFRMRPDGTELEVVCTGTRNHLEVAINAADEMFTYDNTDDGLGWWTRVTHMVDGGFYGYPWDYRPRRPYTLWMMADYGGGSPTGALAYTEDALPEEYRGDLFLCEWARSQLLRLKLKPAGATYQIASRQDLLGGTSAFRPNGICVSPDGLSFYITDWAFGGWTQKKKVGRLLKLTWTGRDHSTARPGWFLPASMGRPFEATAADLLQGLRHPAQSVRMTAQRRLVDRGRDAVEPLIRLLSDETAPLHARWHAIWALDGLRAGQESILAALDARDPTVRRQAARQAGDRRVRAAVEPLLRMLRDPDAALRFQAATSLGRIGDRAAIGPLRAALAERDLFARFAAFTAMNRIGRADPAAFEEIARGLSDEKKEIREGTRFALRETFETDVVRALARFVGDASQPPEWRAETLPVLADLHRREPPWDGRWWGTQPAARARPERTLEWAGTAAVLEALRLALRDPSPLVRQAAIEGQRAARDPGAAPALRALFETELHPDVRRAIVRALGAMKDPDSAPLVASILRDPLLNSDVAAEAVRAAASIDRPESTRALVALAAADSDLLLPAIQALGSLKAGAETVARHVDHSDSKIALAAVEALSQSRHAAGLIRALSDSRSRVRRAAAQSLGDLGDRSAVEPLIRAAAEAGSRSESIQALARMPDLRALDLYLEGLQSRTAAVRQNCRGAVAALEREALPALESRLPELPPAVVDELRLAFSSPRAIADWMVIGPFPNPGPAPFDAVDLQAEYGGRRWRKATALGSGLVDLAATLGPHSSVAAYAWSEIESDREIEAELALGSDDGLTLWLDGKKIFEDLGDRGWTPGQFKVKAKLRAGRNGLLARISQGGGAWGFSVAWTAPRRGSLFEPARPKDYAGFARDRRGDVSRGRALFTETGCAKCHKAGGEGSDIAPDLTGVGAKYGRAELIESVLEPSKQVLDGYRQTLVFLKDGDTRAGLLKGETADELVLYDAQGQKQSIPRSQVKSTRLSELSVMPDGLHSGLSLQEFADLIEYLQSLR
jgi:putative membrane-bound dehydrogenase-like protein